MLIGKPVALVSVPLEGVPKAPPLTTGAPALPTLIAKAVATPVPRPVTPVLIGTVTVPDAPSEIAVPLTVTELLVSDALPMLVSVLLAPEIVLLVRVWLPDKVATVLSIATVTADEPL